MEAATAQLGGQSLDPGMVGQLMAGLRSQSIPNPQTPQVRKDQDMSALLDLQRIRRSVEISLEAGHIGDTDPLIGHLLHAIAGAVKQLIAGSDGMAAVQFLQGAVAPPPAPSPGTPGVQPGPAISPPPAAPGPQGPMPPAAG